MSIKNICFVAVVLLLFFLFGCVGKNRPYILAVNEYNRILQEVLETGEVDLLNKVATESETRRMELFLSFLNEKKKKISADLLNIEFGSVRVRPQQNSASGQKPKNYVDVEVKTKELWKYEYLDPASGRILEGPYRIEYDATYRLVERQGKWVVNEVYFQEKPLNR